MNAIITLTTDLGLTDAYVAAMKGVILSINPEVKLVEDLGEAKLVTEGLARAIRPREIEVAISER